MLFNSFEFLIFFIVFLVPYYFLYGMKYQRYFFLLMSLVFYGYWHPPYLLILIASITVDFTLGRAIFKAPTKAKKKAFFIFSLVLNLGMLSYFKYADFLRESLNQLLLGFNIHWQIVQHPFGIVLPIGISFYTFQSLSYIIDVYRGKVPACKKFSDFALYVTYFPHLVAGPLIRFEQYEPFRQKPWARATLPEAASGAVYIALGLFKKVLISDNIAWWVNQLFSNFNVETSALLMVLGTFLFAIQIYCDFSGYSDIAIGLGRFCGIVVPDNFNNPYFARSISDFWQRWHITLSQWLKDYLYISLGGNRKGKARQYVNLMITMLLGGLWHGNSWNFVLWGGLQGLGLAAHKAYEDSFLKKFFSRIPFYAVGAWLGTFSFVLLSWLVFRIMDSHNLSVAFQILISPENWRPLESLRGSQIKKLIPFVLMFFAYELVMLKYTKNQIAEKILSLPAYGLYLLCFVYGVFFAMYLPGSKAPFIYFQF